MRDRRARMAAVGLILLFPALMAAMSPRFTASSLREALVPVLATEALLVAGLAQVVRERRRLQAETAAPKARRDAGLAAAPHTSRPLRKATLGRF